MHHDDLRHMKRALELANLARGDTHPNPMVGCVLVRDGVVLGEGYHKRAGEAHGEVAALREVREAVGATAYVNLEPCNHTGRTGPCSEALIAAKVSRVVVAMIDPNPKVQGSGIQKLRDAGITVEVGLLEAEAKVLNEAFIHSMAHKRPFSVLKIAQTLDGKIADPQRRSQWITGPAARQRVHQLRAESDAIITGIGTILADNPSLTVREAHKRLGPNGPVRVIVDSQLKIPRDAKILHDDGPRTIIATTREGADWEPIHNVSLWTLPAKNHRVDLRALYQRLHAIEFSQVMVEAGAALNGALFDEGLVDKLFLFIAPKILGSAQALSSIDGAPRGLPSAVKMRTSDIERVGDDWLWVGYVESRERSEEEPAL
jgi:diaminohydroxyphosphoribosylaminopyrimidine deaminase / 5-amino-6-(5-phosphoribosylamino)uracil reductase